MGFQAYFTNRSFSGVFPTKQEAAAFACEEHDPQALIMDNGHYAGTAAELV